MTKSAVQFQLEAEYLKGKKDGVEELLGLIEENRDELTLPLGECYSRELSTCKLHDIFQPQKFLNKLFPYLHSKGGSQ